MGGDVNREQTAQSLVNHLVAPSGQTLGAQDSEALVDLAQRHRLLPTLQARQAHGPQLSRTAAARLHTLVRLEQMMTGRARLQLVELLDALEADGVEVIVLKGFATTALAPGQARLGADHDLLVRPEALDTVDTVMRRLGYTQQTTEIGAVERYRTTHHHDAPWSRPDCRQPVEIHRHPLGLRFHLAYDAEGLWQRAVPLQLDRIRTRRLGDVDQVIHLAVHCTEDGPARHLRELWELAGWARRLGRNDWAALLELVTDPILARRVWAGLAGAAALFEPELPRSVLDELATRGRISPARQRRWLAAVVRTSVDAKLPRWQGWAVRRGLEAGSAVTVRLAEIAGAVAWARHAGARQRPPGVARQVRVVRALVAPALQGWRWPGPAVLRLLDVIGALVLGILAVPVLAVLAVVLLVRSPGPIVYQQVRVGRHGLPFRLLKLRTMPVDAEGPTGPRMSPRQDPRILNGFAWVRRTHLDELPQLWNVLIGEMSLVGPRPERPEFTRLLRRALPAYDERHRVRPGLTGLAQIRVGYHAPGHSKLAHDLVWVRRPGLGSYLRILLATPWSILVGPADHDADPQFAHLETIDLTEHDEITSSVA